MEVKIYTNDFSNVIARGGFSIVYKGSESNSPVAITRYDITMQVLLYTIVCVF